MNNNYKYLLFFLVFISISSCSDIIHDNQKTKETKLIKLSTNMGDITIELFQDKAPETVANFLKYTNEGKLNGTIFHRVIPNFMIQGGDFQNSDGTGGYASGFYGYCNGQQAASSQDCSPSSYTLPDEADNGLLHESCTISMAKTSQANTGGSQFFLIPEDSAPDWLDGKHTVFGSIVSGCDVVTSISEVPTHDGSGNDPADRPVNPVVLISAALQ